MGWFLAPRWVPTYNLSGGHPVNWAEVRTPRSDKPGGLNGSTQHSLEGLFAGISMAKFVRER
jgi:hypothetical protein